MPTNILIFFDENGPLVIRLLPARIRLKVAIFNFDQVKSPPSPSAGPRQSNSKETYPIRIKICGRDSTAPLMIPPFQGILFHFPTS